MTHSEIMSLLQRMEKLVHELELSLRETRSEIEWRRSGYERSERSQGREPLP